MDRTDPLQGRFKVALVSPDFFLALGRWPGRTPLCVTVPAWEGLPENVSVREVHYLPEYHAFGLWLYHESFEQVPFGAQGEMVHPKWRAVEIDIRKD